MKRHLNLLLTIIFCAISINSNSQDLITKKDGSDISAKVLEITSSEIKYKKFENLSGPIFTILKSDVEMIKYENGTKINFNESISVENISSTKKDNKKNNIKPQYFSKCDMIIGDEIIVKKDTKGLNKNVSYYYQKDCQINYQQMIKALKTIDVCRKNVKIAQRNKLFFSQKKGTKYLLMAIEDYNKSLE